MQSTTDKHYYVANVPPALFQCSGLSPMAKIVTVCLLLHKNRTSGLCYVTQELLAIECEVSRLTVTRALAELRDRGLVTWEARKAPRGRAKGRANSYDLSGLEALCSQPVKAAAELETVSPMIHREVSPMIRHASGNRAITVNSLRTVTVKAASIPGSQPDGETRWTAPAGEGPAVITQKAGDVPPVIPHSARIAQAGPLAGLSPSEIQQQRLAPDGTSAFEVCADTEAWVEARHIVEDCAGGEPFNPGALSKLCDECGNEAVWYHAKWFLRRLASRKTPPVKATAFFVDCVRKDRPVNPTWPAEPAQAMVAAAALAFAAKFTEEMRGQLRASEPTEAVFDYESIPF